jgi:hypothetical protein
VGHIQDNLSWSCSRVGAGAPDSLLLHMVRLMLAGVFVGLVMAWISYRDRQCEHFHSLGPQITVGYDLNLPGEDALI